MKSQKKYLLPLCSIQIIILIVMVLVMNPCCGLYYFYFISPTHKRTEGRAPVWDSEFTSKRRRTTGGDPAETAIA